jgi:hypothetical protein
MMTEYQDAGKKRVAVTFARKSEKIQKGSSLTVLTESGFLVDSLRKLRIYMVCIVFACFFLIKSCHKKAKSL